MNIISSITSSIASSILAASSTIAAWFKLLTTNPVNSSPTQGTTTFIRASAANYIDSAGVLRSAAVDTPRYQDGGLLIEQASTNICTNSEVGVMGASVPRALGVAPDGTVTAENFVKTTATSSTPIGRLTLGTPPAAGTVVTVSLYMKPIGNGVSYGLYSPMLGFINMPHPELDPNAVYNPVTGYYRVQAQLTSTGTAGDLLIYHKSFSTSAGNGVDGNYVWGVQLEVGSKATSYIKTVGAAATRAADICYTAATNIPNLTRGAEFVWKGALPNDGGLHVAFRSSPAHTLVRRHSNGTIEALIAGNWIGMAAGIDTAVHTYTLRTNGSNLHELLVDDVVVLTSTQTGMTQPTTPMYIGSTNGWAEFSNSSTQSFAMYSKAFVAWFKLLTTDPAASSPTQGATSFSRASSGTAVDANGLLVSYAADVPRQQDGGLLIEQASTNLCRQSQDFTNAAWVTTSMSTAPAADTTVAPDGTTTADTLTFDAVANSQAYQNGVITAAGTYTLSVWAKVATGTKLFRLFIWNSTDNGVASLDFTATTTWQRFTFTLTVSAASYTYVKNNSTATAGTLEVWGYQVEAGSKATSYIKTLAAPVTRAADICYTAAANIPTLANGATFVWKGAIPDDGVNHTAFQASPNYVLIRRNVAGSIQAVVGGIWFGGSSVADAAVHTYALRTNGSNLHELLVDGVVVSTSTATGLLQPTSAMYVGSQWGNTQFANGSTQSFTMYDTALTDAEIQGLG